MNVTVIILAAGRGVRLGDLTEYIPKCLIELSNGVTILDSQLSAFLTVLKPSRIYIAVGYRGEKIKAHVVERYPDAPIECVDVEAFLAKDNAHSLREVLRLVEKGTDILQCNGDVLFDPSILKDVAVSRFCPQDEARIFVREAVCGEEEMKVLVGGEGMIRTLSKQMGPDEAFGEAFGVNYFSSGFARKLTTRLDELERQPHRSYFEDGINLCLKDGAIARPYAIGERFATEVDFPEDLQRARTYYSGSNLVKEV